MKRIVLIPAYKPDEKMIQTAKALNIEGFEVIIVNDGSPGGFDTVFDSVCEYAHVLCNKENKGKGEAIKTGLRFIRGHFDIPYIVVNADGMEGKIPLRSRLGNSLTRLVFRLATQSPVYDTQTGLRAYSDKLIDRLIKIEGSRYEYEMNMLMELSRDGVETVEVWIDTVYLDNNSASHFDPIKDSAKIYFEILKFCASSFISFILDYCLFCLLSALTGSLVLANVAARIVSGTVNFTLNKKVVFHSNANAAHTAVKYIALAVFVLICNTLVLKGLTSFGLAPFAAKIITEIILFIFNYLVQHSFVFKQEVKAT